MNVVTVAYLAVLREVRGAVAGTDAADASLVPRELGTINGTLSVVRT